MCIESALCPLVTERLNEIFNGNNSTIVTCIYIAVVEHVAEPGVRQGGNDEHAQGDYGEQASSYDASLGDKVDQALGNGYRLQCACVQPYILGD